MAFEVELKFRDVDHAALRHRLAALEARPLGVEAHEDTYLTHPARDFRQSGEAFRIRRIGDQNRITYKGPKHPGPAKTREEIELGFDPGPDAFAQLARLLEYLGFRPVRTVRKRRESHALTIDGRHLEVGLGSVEDLGAFAEVEAIARDEADLDPARRAVLQLAERLGLDPAGHEPTSYLGLLLAAEKAGDAPAQPG